MKYTKNYLGFNLPLENLSSEKLKLLNKSVVEIVKENKDLSNIKQLIFSNEATMEDSPYLLKVSGQLRSGESFSLDYFKKVNEEEVVISDAEIGAYFGESKKDDIASFLNDNYGNFDSNFLKVHEPILYSQLCLNQLLDVTPNTEYGLEVTQDDMDFLISIAKNTK